MSEVGQSDLAVVQGNHHPAGPFDHRRFQPGFAQISYGNSRVGNPANANKGRADREVSKLFRCQRTGNAPAQAAKLTPEHHVTDPGDVGNRFGSRRPAGEHHDSFAAADQMLCNLMDGRSTIQKDRFAMIHQFDASFRNFRFRTWRGE